MATHEKVDVAIVGAGPTGAIFADILTKAGKKVVILEFGPDWKHQDFISSEIWGRRIKHAPQFQMAGRNNPGHGSNAGWGAGGSMLHWFANFPRLLPVDFKVKSQYGRGMDWPISYDDLAPYYDRVAVELGVSGDAEKEKRWRPVTAPYPMPPLKTFRHGEIWREAFEAHNIPLAPMPTGINSTEYKGRPACLNDGWCHVGCPIGAHGQPLWTHLKEAREKGAEFRPFSYVTRVLTNDKGDRVTGVEYYDDKHEKQVQEASAVVLAAYSAEIPRIMLNSATDKHPKGLSNKNELVGKYLMTHSGASVWAIFDENVENHMGTTSTQFMSYERYAKDRPKKGFGSAFYIMGNALKPNAGIAGARPELFGQPLADFMKRAVRGLARINVYGEEMPRAENRVELSSDKDAFGMPMAKMIHSYDQDAIDLWDDSRDDALEIAKAAKPVEAWKAGGAAPGTIHLNGGTIMGTGPENSVTNSYGQTHELGNLYLAGSGLLPTEGALHLTNTLMAVSIRGAEQMVKNWSSIAS
jgi:choline dehydrogenase-like flavoprotein